MNANNPTPGSIYCDMECWIDFDYPWYIGLWYNVRWYAWGKWREMYWDWKDRARNDRNSDLG